jgi:biopolymer transport protein ExbD
MNRRFNTQASTESSHENIDLKPFINFLVVLIPVLMLSAEFAKTSINKLHVYKEGTTTDSLDTVEPLITEKLKLTLFVTDSALTVATNYGFMPSMYYKEYAQYVQKNNSKNMNIVPNTESERRNAEINGYELSELLLYTQNEEKAVNEACYYKGKLLVDIAMKPVTEVKEDMDFFQIDNPGMKLTGVSIKNIEKKPLSVYDNLQCLLLQAHERYGQSVADGNSIIIASDNKVVYDKIVQLMDVSKASGFTEISIAKIRT